MTLAPQMSLSQVYRASAEDFISVVAELRAEEVKQFVPACPDWTVLNLLAHQSGTASDVIEGRLEAVASPEWTGRQMAYRHGASVPWLINEWRSHLDEVAELCDQITGPNPAWDVAVHLADLRECLQLPPSPVETGWRVVLEVAIKTLADGLPITTDDGSAWGDSGKDVSVPDDDADGTPVNVVSDYELFRILFSRRSRAATSALVTSGDPELLLERAAFILPAD